MDDAGPTRTDTRNTGKVEPYEAVFQVYRISIQANTEYHKFLSIMGSVRLNAVGMGVGAGGEEVLFVGNALHSRVGQMYNGSMTGSCFRASFLFVCRNEVAHSLCYETPIPSYQYEPLFFFSSDGTNRPSSVGFFFSRAYVHRQLHWSDNIIDMGSEENWGGVLGRGHCLWDACSEKK